MVATTRASQTARTTPSHLTTSMIDRLRTLLAAELAERHRAAAAVDSDDDGAEREVAGSLAARNAEVVADLEDALERLDDGRYGTCERCGTEIPFERLEAMPATRLCVACPHGPVGFLG